MFDELKERYPGSTLVEIFWNNVEKYKDKALVHYKSGDTFSPLSWKEFGRQVEELGSYLLSMGIRKGDRVAIFAFNRYEWWIADLASLSIGAVTVPIYATNSSEEARFILQDSECKLCFCGNKEHLKKINDESSKLKKLKTIVSFDSVRGVVSLKKAMAEGKKMGKSALFYKRVKAVKDDQLASIIYTSGTTGNPKGVMIHHSNFHSNVLQLLHTFDMILNSDDTFLSFLPLSHALERTAGYYVPITVGASVAFAESFQTIQSDMQELRPTVIISVPRLYEKIHAGVLSKLRSYPFYKKFFINRAFAVGKKNIENLRNGRKAEGALGNKVEKAEKGIFSKLKQALGMDRIRIAISGGGALSYADTEFFLSIGLLLYEGYGLTECSPVTNVNKPGKIKLGTVGPPLLGTEIKISDQGEVLIKGPQVMSAYYKSKDKSMFTKDGFFKSGDIGLVDDEGYLTLTGRIKDIMVTAGGKNISPQNIENKLKESTYIENIAIVGDGRQFISALVSVAHDELKAYAKKHQIEFASFEELVQDPRIYLLYEHELERLMGDFARVEQVKRFKLIADSWSQATGELTPTLKVKRRVINEKYAHVIDEIYAL